jgi:hypothetical protein
MTLPLAPYPATVAVERTVGDSALAWNTPSLVFNEACRAD